MRFVVTKLYLHKQDKVVECGHNPKLIPNLDMHHYGCGVNMQVYHEAYAKVTYWMGMP